VTEFLSAAEIRELTAKVAREAQLIGTEEIAALLGCTRKNVTQRVIKAPDFPAPKINRSQKMRRWERAEVMAWANPGAPRSPQESHGNSAP